MAEYKEIVQMLRVLDGTCKDDSIKWVAGLAADAIEEMSEYYSALEDGHLYVYRDGILYRSTVAIPKGKTITVPPFQFNVPPKEGQT